jgi:hypothetical protein
MGEGLHCCGVYGRGCEGKERCSCPCCYCDAYERMGLTEDEVESNRPWVADGVACGCPACRRAFAEAGQHKSEGESK